MPHGHFKASLEYEVNAGNLIFAFKAAVPVQPRWCIIRKICDL